MTGYLSGKEVLLFGQKDCLFTEQADSHLRQLGCKVTLGLGSYRGEPFDETLFDWNGDYIFSFKCYWKIPKRLLRNAEILAINFHPATPDYPGSGSYSWALYDGQKYFGVTVHRMTEVIDSGEIIAVYKFKIDESYDLISLIEASNKFSTEVFCKFMDKINLIEPQQCRKLGNNSEISWSRKPRKIQELDSMTLLSADMTQEEVDLRIRAFNLKKYPLRLKMWGHNFRLDID